MPRLEPKGRVGAAHRTGRSGWPTGVLQPCPEDGGGGTVRPIPRGFSPRPKNLAVQKIARRPGSSVRPTPIFRVGLTVIVRDARGRAGRVPLKGGREGEALAALLPGGIGKGSDSNLEGRPTLDRHQGQA